MPAGCASLDRLSLQLPLLGDENDRSGNEHTVTLHGAVVDENGANFNGSGDYITVSSFDYYSDASFSISYWMTKEGCTSGVYEYVYSHQQARDLDLLDPANSNVNMYLACESTGGGWSTSAGSVIRFLLQDSSGSANYARFDYPLHDAGDFDAITSRWVHIVLSVDGSSSRVETYADGQAVRTGEYGYYIDDIVTANTAYPNPGALTSRLTGFNLLGDIFLGSRSDAAVDRHFVGGLAGVAVSSVILATEEAQCLFDEGEEYLPEITECSFRDVESSELAISLLGAETGLQDQSPNRRNVTNHGASLSNSGATFGDEMYITVGSFEYASDSSFSISLWVAKQSATCGTFEYLYSHMEQESSSWDSSSYALIMFLCEHTKVEGGSTAEGSLIRYDVQDTAGHRGTFDFSVHDAGDFDAITSTWVHVILTVSSTAMQTYADGRLVADEEYGFFTGLSEGANIARPTPRQLSPSLTGFRLQRDIHLGGRFDQHRERAFAGRMALVSVYGDVVTGTQASCIFHDGDDALPPLGLEDSCATAFDDTCDEPYDCAAGTDTTDCAAEGFTNGNNPYCPYTGDGECDEGPPGAPRAYCTPGSDTADCCSAGQPLAADSRGRSIVAANVCCGTGCAAPGPDACQHANDGTCDEPPIGFRCPRHTDTTDCSQVGTQPCRYHDDGECDEGPEAQYCLPGTDTVDCCDGPRLRSWPAGNVNAGRDLSNAICGGSTVGRRLLAENARPPK